jgi:outer membrane protein OmpA-like peptidoglycan-associated protein
VALLLAMLAGCATQSGSVVLLPERDGRDAAVTVTQGERSIVLDRPYAAAELTSAGPRATTASAADVESRFGAALAAQPMRPTAFTLFFVEQTDGLTEASQGMLDGVLAAIARYPVPDVIVVGHTDLVGSDAFNDQLARKRAEAIRQMLIARGIAPGSIVTIGRGKREPAVPTADGVAEPRNRRVEMIVR